MNFSTTKQIFLRMYLSFTRMNDRFSFDIITWLLIWEAATVKKNFYSRSQVWKIFIFIFSLVSVFCAAYADVKTQPLNVPGHFKIQVVESISHKDVSDLRRSLAQLKQMGATLHMNSIRLNSSGGDPDAARSMGRFIRSQGLNTFVGPKDSCTSACVAVLIGGVNRMAFGKIYVHRGRFLRDVSEDVIREQMPQEMADEAKYIAEMGISAQLADAIHMTPNWALRLLKGRELLHWGVHGINPVEDEILSRRAAKELGIPLASFHRLYIDSIDQCKNEAMQFQRTILDCVVRVGKKRQF
jgi:hypothetical protein